MKRLIPIFLAALLLSGCALGKTPYVPTGNGLYQDTTTLHTRPPSAVEQQLQLIWFPENTLNPYKVSDYTNKVILPLLYQGLFTVSREYEVFPVLCKTYTVSQDMLRYTFYLENATFSDGSPLTAQDVAASLLAARDSTVYRGRLQAITDITVTEDGGVQVLLSTPYENLPLILDVPIVKESDVEAEVPLGTGAYYMSQSAMEGQQGLQRRADWWCRSDLLVSASFIPLVEAQSPYQIRNAFEFGHVSIVCTDPGSDTYVDYRNDHEVWQCENGIFLYIGVCEKSKVFSNTALRQALTHAIDREALVSDYYRGFAQGASLPASPASPFYDQKLADQYAYDFDQFAQAVEAAGVSGSKLTLLVNKADSRRVRAAEAIGEMLEKAGFTVTVSALSGTSYTNALKNGSYDLHLGQTILSPNMDLSAFFDLNGALSYGGVSDAALLALCQEAMANAGNYYTLHKAAMEDAMLCPVLFRSYAIYGARGVLSEMEPARDQLFFYTLGKTLSDAKQPES